MKLYKFVAVVTLAAWLAAVGHTGNQTETGLKVGTKAPEVTFIDQHQKKRTLKELTKKGMLALVFHRSARW